MEKAQSLPGLHDGKITINTASIPACVRDDLAAATLDFIHRILQQPSGREVLDARTATRKAAQAATGGVK